MITTLDALPPVTAAEYLPAQCVTRLGLNNGLIHDVPLDLNPTVTPEDYKPSLLTLDTSSPTIYNLPTDKRLTVMEALGFDLLGPYSDPNEGVTFTAASALNDGVLLSWHGKTDSDALAAPAKAITYSEQKSGDVYLMAVIQDLGDGYTLPVSGEMSAEVRKQFKAALKTAKQYRKG